MDRRRWLMPLVAFSLFVAFAGIPLVVVRKALAVGSRRESVAEGQIEVVTFTPTDRYIVRKIEGWTVLVNPGLMKAQPELAGRALELLQHQFYQVVRKVPAPAVEKLRKVRFWIEEAAPHATCMAYHPNEAWLRERGVNPEKATCVEIMNVRRFLDWTLEQPWMALHELAHAYHHQFLSGGFENAEVKDAYRNAMKAKLYDSVLRINGRHDRAYAATNHKEFFAEESESFFGTNDFYPFVTSELKQHDPEGFAMLQRLWGSK